MHNQSTLSRIAPLTAICGGALLIAAAMGFAMAHRPAGEVVIMADEFARLVLVQDVAEIRQFEILNRTGRSITLHGAQGWG